MVKKVPPSEVEFPRGDRPDSYAPHNQDALSVAPGSSLVWALRGIPYTASTAAADVIDNSIAAGAQNVWILNRSAQDPMDSFIAFVDDGHGMTEAELHKAMIHGSSDPRRDREAGDFGRFGLGLKTASLSQGKRLTVWSKKSGHKAAIRQWDLDLQGEEGWVLFSQPQRAAERLALEEVQRLSGITSKSSGTIVLWSSLDVLLETDRTHEEPASEKDEGLPIHVRLMNRKVTEIIEHSESAFHRFLGPIEGRPKRLTLARIFEDGSVHKCTPWDPFLQGKAHLNIPVERPPQQKVLRGQPGEATLQPVILPHESNVPAETFASLALSNRNLNSLQGFYVYREERLIVAGDWLGLYPPEIHYSLGRIAIFLSNDKNSDKVWSIKVNKDSVQIPDAARQELVRIAKSTRKRSNDVFRRSGQTRGQRTDISKTLVPLWVQKRVDLDGERFLQFKINRTHPLVKLVVKEPQRLGALLSAIEGGMPYEAIKNLMSDGDKFSEESDPTVALSHLKEVIEVLADEEEKPCDTLTRIAKDVAPYNSTAFAVAVGLLRAELGCKTPRRTAE
jgi:hypothetical protein